MAYQTEIACIVPLGSKHLQTSPGGNHGVRRQRRMTRWPAVRVGSKQSQTLSARRLSDGEDGVT